MPKTKPRLNGSTRRRNGRRESPHINNRGVVTVGLLFYLKKRERGTVSNLKDFVEMITHEKWEQADLPKRKKVEVEHVFLQTKLPDSEYASNDPFIEYLTKVTNILEDHPVKQQLKELKHKLTNLKLRGVERIETVFDVYSTISS